MRIEIISIGDELLIGQTINTNAAWLGVEFSRRNYSIDNAVTIKDERGAILDALSSAHKRSDIIIITGGLGPTKDDITKTVLCEFFDTKLVLNQAVLDRVSKFFEDRGREMLESNRMQAMLPEACKPLDNDLGTASGMLFDKDGVLTVSLPGVPYEMKHLMLDRVFPIIEEKFPTESLFHSTVQLQGIGESFLAERISDIENELRNDGLSLAYLPKPGLVRLRLSGTNTAESRDRIAKYIDRIEERLPQYMFTRSNLSISEVIGELLVEKKETLGTVESCTGGAISKEIVQIPGSSRYFQGAIVSYTNELKHELVGVDEGHFTSVGAVSEEVVTEMAKNGRLKLGVDYCISTSGIAGPDGGTEEKPVGTVWIAVAGKDRVIAKKFLFGADRSRNISKTVLTALNLLRCEILKINIEKS